MVNIVKTVFTVDATPAFSTADAVEARYAKIDSKAKTVSNSLASGAASDLEQAFARVNGLTQQIKSSGLITGNVAKLATAEATRLSEKLRQIRIETSRTTDPTGLKTLQQRLKDTSLEAENLSARLRNVATSRATAEQSKLADFRSGKLSTGLNAASNLGVPGAGFASELLEGATMLPPIATSIVAILGAGAAFIIAAKWASEAWLKEANLKLKSEEKISIEYGRQKSILFDIVKSQYELNNLIAADREGRAYNRDNDSRTKEELDRKILLYRNDLATTQKYAGLSQITKGYVDPVTQEKIKLLQERIRGMESLSDARGDKLVADQDRAMESRNEQFKRSQQQARELELKKYEEAKEGVIRVKELGTQFKTVFSDISLQVNKENPFVSLFSEADKQLTEFRKNTQGLSKDLIALGTLKLRADNSLKLFEQRLNTSLEAQDLRDLAATFRGTLPQDKAAESDTEYRTRIKSKYSQEGGRGNVSVEDQIAYIQKNLTSSINSLRGVSDSAKNSALVTAFADLQKKKESAEGTQSKLQRQLDAIDRLRPESEAERSASERSVLNLTKGLDPTKLTSTQRTRVAEIADRQATLVEKREIEAIKIAREMLDINRRIDVNQKRLIDIAVNGGINAIRTEITVKDETKSGVSQEQRPSVATQEDVNKTYFDEYSGGK